MTIVTIVGARPQFIKAAAVSRGLRSVGLEVADLNVILTLGNSEAIALAVQQGVGAGYVSRFVADRMVKEGVQVVDVRGLSLRQDVYLVQSRRHETTTAQAAFWKFVTDPQNPLIDDYLWDTEHVGDVDAVLSVEVI